MAIVYGKSYILIPLRLPILLDTRSKKCVCVCVYIYIYMATSVERVSISSVHLQPAGMGLRRSERVKHFVP